MMVQAQEGMGEGSAIPTDSHHTPTIIPPSTSQSQKKQRSRRPKRKDTKIPQSSVLSDNVANEAVNEEMNDTLERATTIATSLDVEQDRGNINKTQSKETHNEPSFPGTSSGGEDRLKLRELMELYTTLQSKVFALETIKTTQTIEIESLKKRVKKLERRNKSRTHGLKRLYKIGLSRRVESSKENEDDANMFDVNTLTGDEVIVETKVDHEGTITTTTAATTVTAASIRPKAKGLVIHEEEQATTPIKALKEKLEEDKESEELKQCLEIILDDGDDVTIDATPLSTKSPTIVDYKIYQEEKKSNFQIIRSDGKTQMYLTFGKMLKNIDREDLEVLWSITMFDHHVEDDVRKKQQGLVKVMNWKLFDSCGVHCVTMQSMMFYLLVEKMYLLTKHKLHQMFNNVKLQVDYDCEMAFELLRLGRIVGIKRLLDAVGVTTALMDINAAQKNTARVKLVLLVKNEENILSSYYCLYTVNAAGRIHQGRFNVSVPALHKKP
ncbi:hypothetical protein Tco_0643781 [Tanacetum coccineum]